MKRNKLTKAACLFTAMTLGMAAMASADTAPADMSKPVQVILIMGQSNTLEMGKVTPELGKKYPFLADDAGAWTTRKDVRNVSVMTGRKGIYRNDWMTISNNKIGIEIGVGHQVGDAIEAPVMVLKSSIGNRSLGWDLLPPGTPRYSHNGKEEPAYGETFQSKKDKTIVPYVKGGDCLQWYAGKQYDDDVANAKKILADLGKYYPGAKSYEVAGIVWWQGDKDMRNASHTAEYEKNLVRLVKALRKDFNAPKAAFVCASLGQTDADDTKSGHGKIMQAMKNFASGKYKSELGDNIGFVYSKPLLDAPSGSSGHYGGNAKTYMNVGLGLGKEMAKQLQK